MYVISKEKLLALGVKEEDIKKLVKPKADLIIIESLDDIYREFSKDIYACCCLQAECEYTIIDEVDSSHDTNVNINDIFKKEKYDCFLSENVLEFEDKRSNYEFATLKFKIELSDVIEKIEENNDGDLLIDNLTN